MTTGDPAGGDHEVLSYGSDDPPRRPPPLLVGAAATVLAIGLGAGLLLRDSPEVGAPGAPVERAAQVGDPAIIRLAAGSVGRSALGTDDSFWLSVFNRGQARIVVELADLPGWPSALTDIRATAIDPRSWGVLRFSAPVTDCHSLPGQVRVALVRVAAETGAVDRPVPLAEPADALFRQHHDAVCSSRHREH